jgi:hypothetical protein
MGALHVKFSHTYAAAFPPIGVMPVIFGEVTAGEGLVARRTDGTIEPLQPKGWLHDGT